MAYNRGERPDLSHEEKRRTQKKKSLAYSAAKKIMRSITRT